jgi:hypothetical protein
MRTGRSLLNALLTAVIAVSLIGLPAPQPAHAADPLYRINAGGPALLVGPWAVDNNDNPSQFSNHEAAGTSATIPTPDAQTRTPSVPLGTNTNLFRSHRFDPPGGPEMSWSFPVANGGYIVRLYFSETADGGPGTQVINGPGQRIFDVSIEGNKVINDLDVWAAAGDNDTGIARSFIVQASGGIQIDFEREVQNPMISGIEIIPVDAGNNPVDVIPSAVTFATQPGTSAQRTITLSNLGGSSSPSVTLTGVSIGGNDASDFSHDFPGSVTLGPGDSRDIVVTFDAPGAQGESNATMSVATSGAGTFTVDLTGISSNSIQPSTLGTSVNTVGFGSVAVNDTKSVNVNLTNEGSDLPIAVNAVDVIGKDADLFSVSGGTGNLAPGGSKPVTVTFDPDSSGSKTATLRIDHDGENGPTTLPISGNATTVTIPSAGFVDIGGSIFQEEINWLASTGITRGCNPPANDRFCPEDSVTRGQMAAFLHRALEDVLTPGAAVDFVDDDGSTFEADIEWLAATGVTRGCNPPTNDEFCPEDSVTRGQMAAFLHRALEDQLELTSFPTYIDDNNSTFEADIEWLGATGVTRGCNPPTNDRFCPNDEVTREQMAAFLFRALAEQ